MDFFAAKADALHRSRRLEWMFAVAVVVCVGALTYVTCTSIGIRIYRGWIPYLVVASAWLLVIVLPWLRKQRALKQGGGVVAESLSGTRVDMATRDPLLRRLRNVVEEMAIASGIPVPAIYVLEGETSINAFAAGHRPVDAAIAVTRGALDNLTRDELQGVVAHEFSHILNGDMALNTRMVGWIAGLGGITALGLKLLRSRNRLKPSIFLKFAIVLTVIGAVGTFAGRLLQAAVCRQREWMADASAVQFTRNPTGLRNALLRIAQGGANTLRSAEAEGVAHLLFASAKAQSWFASHPPVRARIAALGPGPDTLPPAQRQQAAPEAHTPAVQQQVSHDDGPPPPPAETPTPVVPQIVATAQHLPEVATPYSAPAMVAATADGDIGETLIAAIGNPDAARMAEVQEIVHALPEFVHAAAASPEAARGLLLALLVSHVPDERARQLAAIDQGMGAKVTLHVRTALVLIPELAPHLRLPTVLELIGPLAMSGEAEHIMLANLVHRLAIADGEIDMFEFCVRRMVVKSLAAGSGHHRTRKPRSLVQTVPALGALLSIVARHGAHGQEDAARRAFRAGVARLDLPSAPEYVSPQSWSAALWAALDEIDEVDPLAQRSILHALVATVSHDGRLVREESELLQLVCAAIGCPVPPLSALMRDELTLLN